MFGVSASHWFLWNQFIDASSHGRLDRPLIVSGQTQTRERRTSAASSPFLQQLHQRLKRGKRRVCSPFRQANAPAFRATAHTRTFPEPSGVMIRFVFPKRRSSRRREHCQDVLCACNDFFIKVIHRFLCLVSCPKQGTVLRTQNLKSDPTAAGGAVKADRSEARNALHSTSRLTAVFFCVRLVTAILLDDFDRLQLHHP